MNWNGPDGASFLAEVEENPTELDATDVLDALFDVIGLHFGPAAADVTHEATERLLALGLDRDDAENRIKATAKKWIDHNF